MRSEGERVAELIVARRSGGEERGSGYRLAPAIVLTAEHLVQDAARTVVRFNGGRPGEWSSTGTVAWSDPESDLAFVRLDDPTGEADWPVDFGRISTDQAALLACEAVGFPLFKLRRDTGGSYRDSHHAHGTIATLSNAKSGSFELVLEAGPAGAPEWLAAESPPASPWSGMSGAVVWSADRVVAVVTEHHGAEGAGVLLAAPIARLYDRASPEQLDELRRAIAALPASAAELVDVAAPAAAIAAEG